MNTEQKGFMAWQRAITNYFWPFLDTDKPFMVLLDVINLITIASNTLLIWIISKAITLITTGNFTHLNQTLLIIASIVLFNMFKQFVYTYKYQKVTLRFLDPTRQKPPACAISVD